MPVVILTMSVRTKRGRTGSVLAVCHTVQGLHEPRAQDRRGADKVQFAVFFSVRRAEFLKQPCIFHRLLGHSLEQQRDTCHPRCKASPSPA